MGRPVIVLYTDAAQIEPDVLKAMTEAGYLPIKVADDGAVRILDIPLGAAVIEDMDVITTAALKTVESHDSTVHATFGSSVAKSLLAKQGRKNA